MRAYSGCGIPHRRAILPVRVPSVVREAGIDVTAAIESCLLVVRIVTGRTEDVLRQAPCVALSTENALRPTHEMAGLLFCRPECLVHRDVVEVCGIHLMQAQGQGTRTCHGNASLYHEICNLQGV